MLEVTCDLAETLLFGFEGLQFHNIEEEKIIKISHEHILRAYGTFNYCFKYVATTLQVSGLVSYKLPKLVNPSPPYIKMREHRQKESHPF